MKAVTRIQLGGLAGANSFLKGHPDDSPSGTAMLGTLDQVVTRANATVMAQVKAQSEVDAISRQATETRDELRDHLGTILTVGKVVSRTIPGVTVPTRGVRPRTSDAIFLATGRAAVAEAESFRDAFIKAGMPEDLPAQTTLLLDKLEALILRRRDTVAFQVTCGVALEGIAREGMEVLRVLDAIMRLRFRAAPDLAAGWKSARNVPYVTPTPAEAPATPKADSTRSA